MRCSPGERAGRAGGWREEGHLGELLFDLVFVFAITEVTRLLEVDQPRLRLAMFAVALAGPAMSLGVPQAYGERAVLFGAAYWGARLVLGVIALRLAERFGLLLLIALGESVVAIGVLAAADERLGLGGDRPAVRRCRALFGRLRLHPAADVPL